MTRSGKPTGSEALLVERTRDRWQYYTEYKYMLLQRPFRVCKETEGALSSPRL